MSAQADTLAEFLAGHLTVPEAVKEAKAAGIEVSSADIYNATNYHRALEIVKLPASRFIPREAFAEWLHNRERNQKEAASDQS